MKKVNTSPKAQARRARALERFTLPAWTGKGTPTPEFNALLQRKEAELKALKQRLGIHTPA